MNTMPILRSTLRIFDDLASGVLWVSTKSAKIPPSSRSYQRVRLGMNKEALTWPADGKPTE